MTAGRRYFVFRLGLRGRSDSRLKKACCLSSGPKKEEMTGGWKNHFVFCLDLRGRSDSRPKKAFRSPSGSKNEK
jgi:hypothetical protein